MAKFGDRVKETFDTSGTGTLDLNGSATGFRSFADEFTTGDDEISYLLVDDPDNPTEYEFGKGTFTAGSPNTFARDTVEGSSNSGNKVSFSAGTKTVVAVPTAADFTAIFGDGAWGTKSAKVRAITGDDSQVAADNGKLIDADGSGNSPAGLTYTLLPAATAGDGFVVTVKNTGSSGTVTIDGDGSETIDGETTLALDTQYQSAELRCDGTEWHRIGTTERTFLDEDDMASDSATAVASQQSIKAYVDSQVVDVLHYQEQRAANEAGPSYSSGGWRTVPLDTEVTDTGNHGSLSSNQVTLAAGTYEVWAAATHSGSGSGIVASRLRLQNITDGTTIIEGLNLSEGSSSVGMTVEPRLEARFVLADSKAIEVQMRVTSNANGTTALNVTTSERYASLYLRKVA